MGAFAFPENTVLQAGQAAVLCSTNPAAFRARYGLPADTLVFGPWSGGLAREGEKLRLLSPGDPEPDGFVPMYRADHVSYRTNSSWAVANTGGISLERWPLNAYGNDPASWRASPPGGTPGTTATDTWPMGTAISVAGGTNPGISFNAIPGEPYEVRYTDELLSPVWKTLTAIPSAPTNWIEVVDPAPTNRVRYYQIIWHR